MGRVRRARPRRPVRPGSRHTRCACCRPVVRPGEARQGLPFCSPPDRAIEILSPDQHGGRFTEKIQFYRRYGGRLVWAIDPATETITLHAPDADPETLTTSDTLDGETVPPGFTLPMGNMRGELHISWPPFPS